MCRPGADTRVRPYESAYRRRDPPPKIPPSVPRRIARPKLEPTDRAALFAAASSIPSRFPPRGPVLPRRMFDSASVNTAAGGGRRRTAAPYQPYLPCLPHLPRALGRPRLELLVGGLAIDGLLVVAVNG